MGDKKKNNNFASMSDILEEKKKLDKKLAKVAIPCSHTNDKGKLKIEFLDNGLARCKKCGSVFSFETISHDSLDKAVRTVHNAINQIKALTEDPDREQGVINSLGQLDYNLKETAELYKKTVSNYGKGGKKKNKKQYDSFGSYGAGSIEFIGGKKKNKY